MDLYLSLAITVLLDVVKDRRFFVKHRAKLYKAFRALAEAFKDDEEAKNFSNLTFNSPK